MIIEFDKQFKYDIINRVKARFARDSIYYKIKYIERDKFWNLVERPTFLLRINDHLRDNFWTIMVEFIINCIKDDIRTRLRI